MAIKKNFRKGVSLVELLIYAAVLSIISGAIVSFVGANETMKQQNRAISEVEIQGREILRTIIQTVKNSQTTSVSGSAGSSVLTVTVDDSSKSPVVFDLNSGAARMKEGVLVPVNLHSPNISVSNLNFTQSGLGSTGGSIKIQFDATYSGSSGHVNYTQTFYGTANPR